MAGVKGQGRRPEPTGLKELKGGRNVNHDEPKFPDGPMPAPSDLSPGARAVWERLAPDMIAAGVLKPNDGDEFAIVCDSIDRNDQARQAMDRDGMVIEHQVFDRNGKPSGVRVQISPWWKVWKETADTLLRYGSRFGMSPSDRAALKVDRPDDPNQAARLLS